MDKKMMPGLCMLLLFLAVPAAYSQCGFILPSRFDVVEGELFSYNITAENLSFTYVPINFSLDGFSLSRSGRIRVIPEADSSKHSLLVIATSEKGCYEVSELQINVLKKPGITGFFPEKNIVINETQNIWFSIEAESPYALEYEWYLDKERQASSSDKLLLVTGYNFSGRYLMEVFAVDSRGINSSVKWNLNIRDRNRAPYLKFRLPNFVITSERKGLLFNANNYVFDADDDQISYELLFKAEEGYSRESKVLDVVVDDMGEVSVFPKKDVHITEVIYLNASDGGSSIMTDPFEITIASRDDAFEYLTTFIDTEKCYSDIKCSEWSACYATGIRTRECYDENNCTDEKLLESEECEYGATCEDNIKNQGEEGVDCGGPCEPCPSCFDGIKNQREERIDCGGPCTLCPSCFDSIKNQNETDVDCGGACAPCSAGKLCNLHIDCESLICTSGTCSDPSCGDYRKNQGESGVDCGGPCEPCETCNDNIQNQGESGVDCGGPCEPCETCFDGIKNQGELFKDCGGPCDCGWLDFGTRNWMKILLAVFVLLFMIIWLSLKKNQHDAYLLTMSRLFGFLPANLKEIDKNTIAAVNKLKKLQYSIASEPLQKVSSDYAGIIQDYFAAVLGPGSIKSSIRKKIKNPYMKRFVLEFYMFTKKDIESSPLFKIEMNQRIDSTIAWLNKIKENA